MMLANGVVAHCRSQKICRHELCSLVHELIKCVLPVGPRLTPDDRPGLIVNFCAAAVNRFPVALHVALLKICREAMHVLVIGKYRLGLSAEKISIPDTKQRQDHRDVLFKRGGSEVAIHFISALQQLLKVFKSDCAGNRQTDCRPQGIAAAYPVPEDKHIFFINAELPDLFSIG